MSTPPLRYLALGDSYTIGEGVEPAERWPELLAAELQARGVGVAPPVVIARTGWTTDELAAALSEADPQGPFHLVSLLIGVNNQYRGRDVEEYRTEFGALLRRAVALAAGRSDRVLALSIPDWGVTPFAVGRDRARIAREIDQFNRAGRDAAAARGVRYVDVTAVSRERGAETGMLGGDGLHPSGRMYREWTRLVAPATLEALS
jgi:lysophospholipase L1-like esterase